MESAASDKIDLMAPASDFDPSRPEEWLERMRNQTSDARRHLAARIDRDRQFKELAEGARHKSTDLAQLMESTLEDYVDGKFFLDHIGLWLEVTPVLAITVFNLRREWIKQYELTSVPEILLVDQAMLAYFHQIRLNKQLGDMEALIDHDLFVFDPPTPKIKRQGNQMVADGLDVEDRVKELQTQLLPVIDRFNVMFLRNLRALRELKQSPIQVNIQQAAQVNVGQQQVNVQGSDDAGEGGDTAD